MESSCYLILAFALVGDAREQKYIFEKVRPGYFEEPCHADIFLAAQALFQAQKTVDILSVSEALTTDADSSVLSKRLARFRTYFVDNGDLEKACTDGEVKRQITVYLAYISSGLSYSTPVELAVYCFIVHYVGISKKGLLREYQKKIDDNPTADVSDELALKLKSLESLLTDRTWENYVIDLPTLETEPDEIALISRKGQGFFYRGNLYLVSGYAGAMKSFLCLAIAAAASNKGIKADRTLSFCSTSEPLKVLFVDTELAKNTIRKRWKSLKMMASGEYDCTRFKYLSLRFVSGDLQAKMHVFDNACRQFKPDFIVLDSGRDLCLDFNDNREADSLVAHFKQIAADLNAVVISTSHKSLGNGNAKGHFGMRLNEAAGLEMSLTKVTDGNETYVKVEFPKQREDQYEPFAFKYDTETGWLVEHAPTVDHQEENRQYKAAKAAVERILRPGQMVKHNDLMRRITAEIVGTNGKNVSERTAKNYINVLSGTVLTCDAEGWYSLVDPDAEIPFDEDLPVG